MEETLRQKGNNLEEGVIDNHLIDLGMAAFPVIAAPVAYFFASYLGAKVLVEAAYEFINGGIF